MTDEELQRTIEEVSEELDILYNSDKPLTQAEKRHRQILSLQKQILQEIKEARAENDTIQERNLAVDYGLLISMGEKHPFLTGFLRTRSKWNVF